MPHFIFGYVACVGIIYTTWHHTLLSLSTLHKYSLFRAQHHTESYGLPSVPGQNLLPEVRDPRI